MTWLGNMPLFHSTHVMSESAVYFQWPWEREASHLYLWVIWSQSLPDPFFQLKACVWSILGIHQTLCFSLGLTYLPALSSGLQAYLLALLLILNFTDENYPFLWKGLSSFYYYRQWLPPSLFFKRYKGRKDIWFLLF